MNTQDVLSLINLMRYTHCKTNKEVINEEIDILCDEHEILVNGKVNNILTLYNLFESLKTSKCNLNLYLSNDLFSFENNLNVIIKLILIRLYNELTTFVYIKVNYINPFIKLLNFDLDLKEYSISISNTTVSSTNEDLDEDFEDYEDENEDLNEDYKDLNEDYKTQDCDESETESEDFETESVYSLTDKNYHLIMSYIINLELFNYSISPILYSIIHEFYYTFLKHESSINDDFYYVYKRYKNEYFDLIKTLN